ncbi:MAG: hypothetical protein GWP10_14675 [Nitrospiraceae bacterium]|nr:hypothetical protein [Nitrospiraceae bacterium]
MKKLLVCVILVLLLLNSFTAVSYADGGPVYQAGLNVIPYHNDSIEMEKEDLFITFFEGKAGRYTDRASDNAKVQAKFVFKNTGNETEQKIGFPFGIPRIKSKFRFIEPMVKVNGKVVKAELVNPKYDSPWLIFTVHFAKNEKKLVEVDYTVFPEPGYFLYVLKTGALWKGTIGELNIDISMQDKAIYPYVISISPEGYEIQGNHIVYHLKDYEPTKNIEIEFLPYNFYKEIKPLRDKAMETNSEEDYYAYAKALLPDDPFGSFGVSNRKFDFLLGSGAADFEKFIRNELNNAFLHTKKGGVKNKILEAALYAHNFLERFNPLEGTSISDQGLYGIDSSAIIKSFAGSPQNMYGFFSDIFGDDLANPQNAEEKEVIAYYFLHLSNAEFAGDDPYAGFLALQKGLEYSKEVSKKETWKAINPIFASILRREQVYPFQECFTPEVEILNAREGKNFYATINFVYTLPAGMGNFEYGYLFSPVFQFYRSLAKAKVPIKCYYEKSPPFRYIVSLNLGSFQTESNFKNTIDLLTSQEPNYTTKYGVNYFRINSARHSICVLYPRFVLKDLTFNSESGVSIKNTISNEKMIDAATNEIDMWIKELADYGNANPELQERLVKYMEFLADNKKLLSQSKTELNVQYFGAKIIHNENSGADNKISLKKVEKNSLPTHPSRTLYIFVIAALLVLVAILTTLLIKKNKGNHSTHNNS